MKLIDSTQLIFNAKSTGFITMQELVQAPKIDPIHAIGSCYCKECKYHSYDIKSQKHTCNQPLGSSGNIITIQEDDFCSHGELK